MNNNLNTVLLAVVLVGTGFNTYMLTTRDDDSNRRSRTETAANEHDGHNHDVQPTQANPVNPIETQPIQPVGPTTSIAFEKSAHDFGVIKQDSKHTYVFKFTNKGENPLIIQNAQGSCGCTVPAYPKEPIPPGATGEITVEYSPGKQQGMQNKTVTITANTDPPQTLLNISANVEVVAE